MSSTKKTDSAVTSDATQTTSSKVGKVISITAPRFGYATFKIYGAEGGRIVVHRFSQKTKQEFITKMETGKAASSKKTREPKSTDDLFNDARYISKDGWDCRTGPVWQGGARLGKALQVRLGAAPQGGAGLGIAGGARVGVAR